jgi:hypothetical protein
VARVRGHGLGLIFLVQLNGELSAWREKRFRLVQEALDELGATCAAKQRERRFVRGYVPR